MNDLKKLLNLLNNKGFKSGICKDWANNEYIAVFFRRGHLSETIEALRKYTNGFNVSAYYEYIEIKK